MSRNFTYTYKNSNLYTNKLKIGHIKIIKKKHQNSIVHTKM